MREQLTVGLFVVHHQYAPAWPGVAVARQTHGQACDPTGRTPGVHQRMHLGQKQLHLEHRAHAQRTGHGELAAHQVGQHLGNGQAQARTRRGGARRVGAGKGLKNALMLLPRQAGAGVFNLDGGHFARVAHPKAHLPARRELDGVAQQVDQNLAHALLVGTHHGRQGTAFLETKSQPLGLRFQLKHAGHVLHELGKGHGLELERELAALDVGNVQRAFNQREQVLPAALDDADRLLAVRGNGGVFAHELCVAQNAVERRAQLVADGADVAAFGLVGVVSRVARQVGGMPGLVGHLLGGLQGFIGLAVQLNLTHQQLGLPVGLFLRHLAAFVRQHHPPGHQASHQNQRHKGLGKARAQGAVGGLGITQRQGTGQPAQLLVVQQAKHAGQQRHDNGHEQQKRTQAVVQVRPDTPGQQPVQGTGPLARQRGMGFAQVTTAGIQRAAQRADGALVSRAMRHVRPLVIALANHAALQAKTSQGLVDALARRRCAHERFSVFLRAGSGNVVPALRGPGNQRRRDQGRAQRNHR